MGEALAFARTSDIMRFPVILCAFPCLVAVGREEIDDGGFNLLQCVGEYQGAARYSSMESTVVSNVLKVAVDRLVSTEGLGDGKGC